MLYDRDMSITSNRIRAGLYRVTFADRVFTVEQIRTETPGYGVETRWWISAADNGAELYIDPQATKADALDALEAEARSGNAATFCGCMVEEDPETGDERVMTHSSTCTYHPLYGDDSLVNG